MSRSAYEVIANHLDIPISKTDWQKRNNNSARMLVRGGRTADDVVDILTYGFEDALARRYFGRISSLAKLIEHWPTIAAMREDNAGGGQTRTVLSDGTVIIGNVNDPPTLTELIAASKA